MKILPILLSDSYKQFHVFMYPKNMTKLYSNMTPRSYKRLGCKESVFFGLQYYIKEYLIKQWNENFFQRPLQEVLDEFKRFHKYFSMFDISVEHIISLHELGYLPLKIKALPEGTKVPERVPYYTIINTHDDHAWLVNFLETQMSTVIWDMTTIATIGSMYREILDKYAIETTGTKDFVQWQGHDFSMRGRSSVESTFNQAGWLLSFTGTDTIPAVLMLEEYYNADISKELVGSSVPASEHSVMTSYGKEAEINAFERLLDQFPKGILSAVSDSFDLWAVLTQFMPKFKDKILARDGKLVIRPDSGNPVDIICGTDSDAEAVRKWPEVMKNPVEGLDIYVGTTRVVKKGDIWELHPQHKGVVELLWDVFGGTVNELGYKVLNPKVGCIYGDSITLQRAKDICERLKAKGFASTNVVFGVGSYTMNYNTRDSLGIAVKSTWCEVYEWVTGEDGNPVKRYEGREIFKDPITDDGTKKSAKGLLQVTYEHPDQEVGDMVLNDQQTWQQEDEGLLETVFLNGKLLKDQTFAEIKQRANS